MAEWGSLFLCRLSYTPKSSGEEARRKAVELRAVSSLNEGADRPHHGKNTVRRGNTGELTQALQKSLREPVNNHDHPLKDHRADRLQQAIQPALLLSKPLHQDWVCLYSSPSLPPQWKALLWVSKGRAEATAHERQGKSFLEVRDWTKLL